MISLTTASRLFPSASSTTDARAGPILIFSGRTAIVVLVPGDGNSPLVRTTPPATATPPCTARPVKKLASPRKEAAKACSPAPEGFARWSLRLLEEKVVELNIVEKASDNTIGRTLKKTLSNPIAIGNG